MSNLSSAERKRRQRRRQAAALPISQQRARALDCRLEMLKCEFPLYASLLNALALNVRKIGKAAALCEASILEKLSVTPLTRNEIEKDCAEFSPAVIAAALKSLLLAGKVSFGKAGNNLVYRKI